MHLPGRCLRGIQERHPNLLSRTPLKAGQQRLFSRLLLEKNWSNPVPLCPFQTQCPLFSSNTGQMAAHTSMSLLLPITVCCVPLFATQLYKNLWSTVMQGHQVLERPGWWKEFCSDKPVVGDLRPKLWQAPGIDVHLPGLKLWPLEIHCALKNFTPFLDCVCEKKEKKKHC